MKMKPESFIPRKQPTTVEIDFLDSQILKSEISQGASEQPDKLDL